MTPRLRKLVVWVGSAVVLAILALVIAPAMIGDPRLHSTARKEWKERAVANIGKRSADPQAITNEIAALHMEAARTEEGWWVGTNVLVVTNGEHLVYSQICSKQEPKIHDIFIAHGSDGKWYFSTYHFCIQMMTARIEEPPGSLREFASTYFAREFNGKSDECLEKTWPVKK